MNIVRFLNTQQLSKIWKEDTDKCEIIVLLNDYRYLAENQSFSKILMDNEFPQISHVKSSARDQEMINQQGIWIQTAMIEGRLHRVQNRSQLSDLKTEFTNYFQWVSC